jgi:D-serine deaminase-like pyridoxal phosphate-dependent protein
MTATDATMDRTALAALGGERIDWRFKGIPAAAWGATVAEFAAARPRLAEFSTPLLTIDAGAMAANVAAMSGYCESAGVLLCPHGKTSMAPALWNRQLEAGAWGITLANPAQLRVARAFGVSRLVLANELVDPAAIRWLSAQLDADPGFSFGCWADSPRGVALLDDVLRECGAQRPLDVFVELGGADGRTGVREVEDALELARSIAATPTLRLIGVAGYEGGMAHDTSARDLGIVDGYLRRFAELHDRILAAGLYGAGDEVYLTAGGSAYFDQVVDVLGTRTGPNVKVLLRSGAYLLHDDGHYRGASAFSRDLGRPLASAMHGWARVLSRPEPGLALLDGGKRDFPYDDGLPEPQRLFGGPAGAFPGASVFRLADQHSFMRLDPATALEVGDVVRLGLSHPCTAMDKWTLVPVLDDASGADPVVLDLVRTFF